MEPQSSQVSAQRTDANLGHPAPGLKLAYSMLRVPRETFAAIIEAWRDGYAGLVSQLTPIPLESAWAYFNQRARVGTGARAGAPK